MDDLVRRLHEQIDRSVAEQGTSDNSPSAVPTHTNRGRSRQTTTADNEWSWRQAQEDRGRQLNAYASEAAPMCADDLAEAYGLEVTE